jgi:type I restriction enzyme S subunit
MKKGWNRKRLGDVLEVQNGFAFDSTRFNPSKGPPLIRIRSLKLGIETETRYGGEYEDKYMVRVGDLLIGMDGEFGCYEWKGEPSLLNQRVCRLQGFSGELLPRFLFYGVNDYLKAIEDVTGFATVKHLSSKQILAIEFPVPPLAEQRRIVGVLDEAFASLATAQAHAAQNLQNARALFESHLNAVVTQRGKGWVEKTIEEVCIIGDGNHSSNYPRKEELVESGVPFIRATNMIDGRISGDDMRFLSPEKHAQLKKGHLKTGDILLTNRGEIGKTAIVDEDYDNANLNSQIAWLRCRQEMNNRFLFHVLNSPAIQAHFESAKNGAALQQFTIRQLKELNVLQPPISEQKSVVAHLDALSAETQRLMRIYEQKLVALAELKKSLLHQAFSGEL